MELLISMFKLNIIYFWFLAGMAGGKYRSFLVHIRSATEKTNEEKSNGSGVRPVMRMQVSKPQNSKSHTLASLLAKVTAGKVE